MEEAFHALGPDELGEGKGEEKEGGEEDAEGFFSEDVGADEELGVVGDDGLVEVEKDRLFLRVLRGHVWKLGERRNFEILFLGSVGLDCGGEGDMSDVFGSGDELWAGFGGAGFESIVSGCGGVGGWGSAGFSFG